jgi:carbon storage regulator
MDIQMLILSRRESESVHLGDDIVLTIVRVSGEKVRIGIEAPPHIKVLRNELEIEVDLKQPAEPAAKTPVAKKPPIQVKRAA